jgi:hypothetical protein
MTFAYLFGSQQVGLPCSTVTIPGYLEYESTAALVRTAKPGDRILIGHYYSGRKSKENNANHDAFRKAYAQGAKFEVEYCQDIAVRVKRGDKVYFEQWSDAPVDYWPRARNLGLVFGISFLPFFVVLVEKWLKSRSLK